MTKKELADQLRHRQYTLAKQKGGIYTESASVLHMLSDDTVIDIYVTCSCCGDKQAQGETLDRIIGQAKDADNFLDLADAEAQKKVHFTLN